MWCGNFERAAVLRDQDFYSLAAGKNPTPHLHDNNSLYSEILQSRFQRSSALHFSFRRRRKNLWKSCWGKKKNKNPKKSAAPGFDACLSQRDALKFEHIFSILLPATSLSPAAGIDVPVKGRLWKEKISRTRCPKEKTAPRKKHREKSWEMRIEPRSVPVPLFPTPCKPANPLFPALFQSIQELCVCACVWCRAQGNPKIRFSMSQLLFLHSHTIPKLIKKPKKSFKQRGIFEPWDPQAKPQIFHVPALFPEWSHDPQIGKKTPKKAASEEEFLNCDTHWTPHFHSTC